MAAFWCRVVAGSGRLQRAVLPAESPIRGLRIQMQQQMTCAYGFIGIAGRPPRFRAAQYRSDGWGLSIGSGRTLPARPVAASRAAGSDRNRIIARDGSSPGLSQIGEAHSDSSAFVRPSTCRMRRSQYPTPTVPSAASLTAGLPCDAADDKSGICLCVHPISKSNPIRK